VQSAAGYFEFLRGLPVSGRRAIVVPVQEHLSIRIALWRRRLGTVSTALGSILFAVACFIYLRYATYPNPYVQERIEHARIIGIFWSVSLFGSALLFVLSWFGLGWGRWVGLILNACASLFALMTLGRLCGPFGCS
jgi:hypothetical protein